MKHIIIMPSVLLKKRLILENTRNSSLTRPTLTPPSQPAESSFTSYARTLDQVIQSLATSNDTVSRVAGLEASVAVLNTRLENMNISIDTIGGRAESIERSIVQPNENFSPLMIDAAMERLGLNLRLDLTFNGHHLLNTPFNHTNINLFGTKLMDILFTKEEQANGTIEPSKRDTPELERRLVDLIKKNERNSDEGVEPRREKRRTVLSDEDESVEHRKERRRNRITDEEENVESTVERRNILQENDSVERKRESRRNIIRDDDEEDYEEEDEYEDENFIRRRGLPRDQTMNSIN
ncbi:unnamed protein product [Brachionus calyciflorus]|uniref:Uncharacterized protein n=1 Tax=Brachionus calyciflorus TaxID=104777 RepID=A0A813ZJK0_9BILA|nr:unnamed protein product [Brachionus calyciflorus]